MAVIDKLRAPHGLAALVFTVLALVGFILVATASPGVDPTARWVTFVLALTALLNLLGFLFDLASATVACIGLVFAVIDSQLTGAVKASGSLQIGYILAVLGGILSFVVAPVDWKHRPDVAADRSALVNLVLGVALVVGSVFLWLRPEYLYAGAWTAVVWLVGTLQGFPAAQAFATFAATVLLLVYTPFQDFSGIAEVGIIVCFVAFVVIVGMYCLGQGRGGGFAAGRAREPKGLLAVIGVVVAVVGEALILVDHKSRGVGDLGLWHSGLLTAVALLNLLSLFMDWSVLSYVAVTLMFALIDLTVTYADVYRKLSYTLVFIGWVLGVVGALVSFATFPLSRPQGIDAKDRHAVLTLVLGAAVLIGVVIEWIAGYRDLQALWLGLLYLVAGFCGYQPGVELSFFMATVLIPGYGEFGSSVRVGRLIIWIALMCITGYHCFRMGNQSRYSDV
eukprot:TRINITY_DN8157_c0_g1_i1.p1 TRINITY_DN8157_c0_g1~~TRINITY_DN8157_c0_g1_i1.p1  ORF type:complete len:450 (+),score=90.57 TRINITY_DN8157_c0_g1_i1:118-1467(+)